MERAEVPFSLAERRRAFSGHGRPTPCPSWSPLPGSPPPLVLLTLGPPSLGPLLLRPRPRWLLLAWGPPPLGGFLSRSPAPGPWRPSFADAPGQSPFVALGMGLCLPCTQVRQRLLAERLPYRQASFRQSEISLGLGVGGSPPSLTPAPLSLLQRDQPLCLSPFGTVLTPAGQGLPPRSPRLPAQPLRGP